MRRSHEAVVEVPGAIIVGAGIAGLFTALQLAPFPALILSASPPGFSGSSIWAQGGIAAALGADDSSELHAADTIAAGAATGDPEVAAFVAREASARIEDLLSFGAPFDRKPDGRLALAREAAHSRSRIVHVSGDRAGAEIMRALARAALASPSISVAEGVHAFELAAHEGRIGGVYARRISDETGPPTLFRGRVVVLASGGIGALYSATTNPPDARGEGLGMAARAGALIADAEFVQFHPTAMNIGRDPAPLATEALRGEGATLVDEQGRRFMPDVHPAGELAPRDVVARAIFREMARGHRIFLDCRAAPGERFALQFPTVYGACRSAGFDAAREPIPVAPAAHYHMGGVATDQHGRSSLAGLWSVGECACTGLHGANRLASNSLLEALVFGARAAKSIKAESAGILPCTAPSTCSSAPLQPLPDGFRAAMMRWVGLERDEAGLKNALAMIADSEFACEHDPTMRNSLAASKLIVAAALARRESLGAHFRRDFPNASGAPKRSFLTLAEAENLAEGAGDSKPRIAYG
ncbi:MAG TPA: L-aspartate oxidase [Rhizomicrobium sp.]|jgi:L-aspartate oxidase|nr:L-aspartate oxidase [Rhizomicrobium sp.]